VTVSFSIRTLLHAVSLLKKLKWKSEVLADRSCE